MAQDVVEDDIHTFWTCPANANITQYDVRSTQDMVEEAKTAAEAFPCLWLRGIVPLCLVPVVPEVVYESPQAVFEGQTPTAGEWPSGHYFGDASGG